MSIDTEEVYRSSNGDRWQLLHDSSTLQALVRHVPNPSSGGAATDMSVEDFLNIDGQGPEFDAVRRGLNARASIVLVRRSAGFFWVQGSMGPEPAYWDGERWSMLSPVTAEPLVLDEAPIRFARA